jgi:hypothetical protein
MANKIGASVSINLAGQEVRIESIAADESGQVTLQISGWLKGEVQGGPLTLTEGQLIELLYQASLSGVLSKSFIGKLREKIEI